MQRPKHQIIREESAGWRTLCSLCLCGMYFQMKNKKNKEIWTVKDVLLWTSKYFKKNEILSSQLNAEMIIAKVLNCSYILIMINS